MKKTIAKMSPIGQPLLLLLSFSLFLSACAGGEGESSSTTTRVGLTINIPSAVEKVSANDRAKSLAPAPSRIAAISVSVADANGAQLASTRAAVSPGEEVTLTLEVPAGRARLFTVQALDEAGAILFQGEASADLTPGVSTTLAVQMSAVRRPTLSISPTTLSLLVGKTQRFTALLTGTADPRLIWSVNDIPNGNAALGTILPSDDATTALYTAPANVPDSNPVTIRVRSAADPELAAAAVVTVLAPPSTVFVNGASGIDGPDCGAENSPCKTITQGLAVAEAGQTLLVAAGTYPFGNATGDEPAPLTMKPDVDIQGAGRETTILDLDDTTDPDGAGILGADNATLSGFTIQDEDSVDFHVSLTGTTTIADNRFIDLCDRCFSTAVRVSGSGRSSLIGNTFGQIGDGLSTALRVEGTASPTISRNTFTENGTAIDLRDSAAPKIEANTILRNQVGISILGSSNPDLGGGERESTGGNTLSCNLTADVTLADTVQAVYARRNFWDHLPPTVSSAPGSGIDIVGEGIDAEGATAASPRCLTEPPTVPLNLIATARSQNQIDLAWSPAIDNFGEVNYQIERCQGANCDNFLPIVSVPETSFSDTGLSAATPYSYRVRAVDVDDNVSPYSNVAGAATPDENAPTPPSNLTANAVSETQINLSWTASTDTVGVAGYRVERCQDAGCTFAEIAQPTGTTFNNTGLSAGVSYSYRVRAIDGAGNLSGYSNTATAMTQDNTAPTPPNNLTAVPVSETRINLSWGASADNVGVAEYRVERCQGTTCANFQEIARPTGTSFNDTGRLPATAYRYRVRAVDAAGNLSGYSNIATATTPDTTPPTPPINLTATVVGGTQINLTWGASTDIVGVLEYRIERCQGANCSNFIQIGTSSTTTFNNSGLLSAISYSYRVRAVDAANNFSGYSNTATAVTLDTIVPTSPTNLTATAVSETQINLAWGVSTDNVGVAEYRVERCQGANCTNFTQIATSSTTSFNNTGLSAATSYNYRVRAVDAAGNFSGYSNTASAATPDNTAPTPPTSLVGEPVSETQINLSWTASTDNIGIAGYRVERCQGTGCVNFAQIGQPTTTTFNDTGLAAGTPYRYRVRAVDAAGNLSGYSNIVTVVTPLPPDTIPPTIPSGLTARGLNQSEIALTWNASTDNVGVAGYRLQRCLATGACVVIDVGLTLGYTDRDLATATAYTYRVRAYDAAGNESLYSPPANASTGRILFRADFTADSLDQPPDTTLPGDPVGDSLSLNPSAGTILIRRSIGDLIRPVELNQIDGRTGGVDLRGTVAGTPPRTGIYTARWQSLVASPNAAYAPIVLRDSAGNILASLAYRPNNILDYNDQFPSTGIGVFWRRNTAQTFEIEVDLDRKTTLLRIDGRIIFESVPFYQTAASDLARISMELGTTSAQTLAWDDIEIIAIVP